MALNKSVLQSSLLAAFLEMNNLDDGSGDRYMADNVASHIKTYILGGTTTTTDAGTAPAGAYTGQGTGTMTIDDSSLADDLYETFIAQYGDDELASHMADDIDKACGADNTVSETTTGTVTFTGGSSAMSGSAEGKFIGDKSLIESKLKACFEAMLDMTEGGNEHFAEEFADVIDSYLKAGTISVTLKSPLSGAGTGKIA